MLAYNSTSYSLAQKVVPDKEYLSWLFYINIQFRPQNSSFLMIELLVGTYLFLYPSDLLTVCPCSCDARVYKEQSPTLFKAAQIPWFQRLSVFRPNPTSILSLTKHRIVSINALRFCRAHRFIVYVHSLSPVPIPSIETSSMVKFSNSGRFSRKTSRLFYNFEGSVGVRR